MYLFWQEWCFYG